MRANERRATENCSSSGIPSNNINIPAPLPFEIQRVDGEVLQFYRQIEATPASIDARSSTETDGKSQEKWFSMLPVSITDI